MLKVESSKLYNNEYMIISTQITNTDFFFTFVTVLVLKSVSRNVLFMNRGFILRKKQNSKIKKARIVNSWKAKFSGCFETHKRSFITVFSICMTVPLSLLLTSLKYLCVYYFEKYITVTTAIVFIFT